MIAGAAVAARARRLNGHSFAALHMSACVKVFGCRPITNGATRSGAGVRKPPRDETAGNGAGACGGLWGFASEQGAEVEQRRCNAGLGAGVKAELSIWNLAAGAE